MAVDRRAQGRHVEQAARDFLIRAGLQPVAANVSYRGGELDLVMRDVREGQTTLVFVEVRYRTSAIFGGAVASIDTHKRRRLVNAALCFLAAHPRWADLPCRFDVIQAQGDLRNPALEWICDAFRADDG